MNNNNNNMDNYDEEDEYLEYSNEFTSEFNSIVNNLMSDLLHNSLTENSSFNDTYFNNSNRSYENYNYNDYFMRFSPYTVLGNSGRYNYNFNNYELDIENALNESFNDHLTKSSLKKNPLKENISYEIFKFEKICKEFKEKSPSCCICCDDYELNHDVCIVPKCNHVFHHECLNEWSKYKENCPICRINI